MKKMVQWIVIGVLGFGLIAQARDQIITPEKEWKKEDRTFPEIEQLHNVDFEVVEDFRLQDPRFVKLFPERHPSQEVELKKGTRVRWNVNVSGSTTVLEGADYHRFVFREHRWNQNLIDSSPAVSNQGYSLGWFKRRAIGIRIAWERQVKASGVDIATIENAWARRPRYDRKCALETHGQRSYVEIRENVSSQYNVTWTSWTTHVQLEIYDDTGAVLAKAHLGPLLSSKSVGQLTRGCIYSEELASGCYEGSNWNRQPLPKCEEPLE